MNHRFTASTLRGFLSVMALLLLPGFYLGLFWEFVEPEPLLWWQLLMMPFVIALVGFAYGWLLTVPLTFLGFILAIGGWRSFWLAGLLGLVGGALVAWFMDGGNTVSGCVSGKPAWCHSAILLDVSFSSRAC